MTPEAIQRDKELRIMQIVAKELLQSDKKTGKGQLKLSQRDLESDSSSSGVEDTDMISQEPDGDLTELKMMSGFKNLICPLCLNFLYKCTTTVCGHSFCERCLDEYLILRKNCFLCDEVVRNKQLVSCFSIDNVIDQIISKVASSQEGTLVKERWDKQKKAHKDWVEGRKIENIEVGEKVDIRDTEYIWCEGKVKIKIECPNRDTLLVVHYEGWNKYYDEIIK